jgi:hypothetical protein
VTGRFTKLDPGSENLRIWIGLGAGESKVCISGEVTDSGGNKLADLVNDYYLRFSNPLVSIPFK